MPALVNTIITGLLAPAIFFHLKQRDEKRKHSFEVRLAEYKKHLDALDEMAAASRADMKQLYEIVNPLWLLSRMVPVGEQGISRFQAGSVESRYG